MKCPYCGFENDKVLDSRPVENDSRIRRRRECLKCSKRFTTYETIERNPIVIVKKDNSRESFDRNKILTGIYRACEKRPVSADTVSQIADSVEVEISEKYEREVPSRIVGEMVMNKLKEIDEIAYVRFASVYRQFKDIDTFMKELNNLFDNEH